ALPAGGVLPRQHPPAAIAAANPEQHVFRDAALADARRLPADYPVELLPTPRAVPPGGVLGRGCHPGRLPHVLQGAVPLRRARAGGAALCARLVRRGRGRVLVAHRAKSLPASAPLGLGHLRRALSALAGRSRAPRPHGATLHPRGALRARALPLAESLVLAGGQLQPAPVSGAELRREPHRPRPGRALVGRVHGLLAKPARARVAELEASPARRQPVAARGRRLRGGVGLFARGWVRAGRAAGGRRPQPAAPGPLSALSGDREARPPAARARRRTRGRHSAGPPGRGRVARWWGLALGRVSGGPGPPEQNLTRRGGTSPRRTAHRAPSSACGKSPCPRARLSASRAPLSRRIWRLFGSPLGAFAR